MGPLREDVIFTCLSRELDNNCATLSKKGYDMDRSAVANKTVTPTAASNFLTNIGIKVSVSTLCHSSQRPVDAPLPMHGPPMFFSEDAEVNMYNAVVIIQLLKACVILSTTTK